MLFLNWNQKSANFISGLSFQIIILNNSEPNPYLADFLLVTSHDYILSKHFLGPEWREVH